MIQKRMAHFCETSGTAQKGALDQKQGEFISSLDDCKSLQQGATIGSDTPLARYPM